MKLGLSWFKNWLAGALLLPALNVFAQLPNAWQIDDNSTIGGSTLQYFTNLTAPQFTSATNNGWRFTVTSRLVTNYTSANGSMFALFGYGSVRFGYNLNHDGNGRLVLNPLVGSQLILTPDASTAADYHTHEMEFVPATQQVTYRFDGLELATWSAQASAGQPRQPTWGSVSSADRGRMNFHSVAFEVAGEGVIARYDAGLEGNPAAAPDPTTLGWSRSAGMVISAGPVSPDTVSLPPQLVTLTATNVTSRSATLRARLYPRGYDTVCYFEYGTTTNYGSFATTSAIPASVAATIVSVPLSGLSPATTYHFRAVATNIAGVLNGQDQSFVTAAIVTTQPATGLLPNAARLNATLDSGGVETSYYWEYGVTTNYGNFTPTNIAASLAATNVSLIISGLSPETEYHFRAMAFNAGDSGSGENLSFSTTAFYTIPSSTGAAAWGDYDNDGRLDILLSYTDAAEIWRNTGSGFSNIQAALPGLGGHIIKPVVAWGDYDNDGRLDMLLAGTTMGGPISQIWRNTGNGFTNISAGLPGLRDGAAAWGDYDNDGRLDLLLTGQDANDQTAHSQIWRNSGNGFVNVNAGLPGFWLGSAAWGDYDSDGQLDVLLTGFTNSSVFPEVTQIWRNIGTGFTNIDAGLPGTAQGAAAWGDYDNDGLLDVLLSGSTGGGAGDRICQIWRNTGAGFTNINAGLPGVHFSSVAWGDYDNDGLRDALLAGASSDFGVISRIYRNTGAGFTNFASLPGIVNGSAALGDADNDGRLDVLLSNGQHTLVRMNTQPTTNSVPSPPTNLIAAMESPRVHLTWNAGSDHETPSAGLTYNLRVGSTPGGADVVTPDANPLGQTRTPTMGNQQSGTNALLLLTTGMYYWSVQTVDAALVGSAFAAEGSFFVPSLPIAVTFPATQIEPRSAVLNAWINPNTLATSYYFEHGLTTNYGSFTTTNSLPPGALLLAVNDTISGLAPGGTYHFRVVASNASGVVWGQNQSLITPHAVTTGLPQVLSTAAAWGDYDRDGRLDLLVGATFFGVAFPTGIWRNTVNGFSSFNPGFYAGYGNAVAWGDYNNDGWLDVLQSSLNPVGFANLARIGLWRNDGDGFSEAPLAITALGSGSLAWGDFDNDGREDVLITGKSGEFGLPSSEIWRNTGNGFTNINIGLPGVWNGKAAWCDFDKDGWLDVIFTGATNYNPTNGLSQLWRNTGAGFSNVNLALPGLAHGSVTWGDCDQDGWPDLLLAGSTNGAASGAIAQIWRNTGGGFTNLNGDLPGVYQGAAQWGDYDNDGRADILLMGRTNDSPLGVIAQIWRNTGAGFTNLNLGLPGLYGFYGEAPVATAGFGDYDQDGRLDLLLAGADENDGGFCGVWLNDLPFSNSPPAAPTGLITTLSGGMVRLAWNPATDAETPSAALSYNLRVGTFPSGGDVVSPKSESTGFRLLPAPGNAQFRTNAFLKLQPGTYHWSVQAVDDGFAGGPFAAEATLVVPAPALSIVSTNGEVKISWQPALPGWVLQQTLSLSAANWSNSPSGTTNPITVPVSSPATFYRLLRL